MNIFVLDNDPKIAAKYHCDKHVIKMTTESLQILGSTHWYLNGITSKKSIISLGKNSLDLWKNFPRKNADGIISPYGIGFMNHPSTKWARESLENWNWLIELNLGLADQYEKRWKKPSPALDKILWFKNNNLKPASSNLTPFYQALPEIIKGEDPIHAYRLYYAGWKEYFAKWKLETPDWWEKYLKLSVEKNLMQERVKARLDTGIHSLSK